MLSEVGFVDVRVSEPFDTFGGARGEAKARAFEVYGYTFLARKPGWGSRGAAGLCRRVLPPGGTAPLP